MNEISRGESGKQNQKDSQRLSFLRHCASRNFDLGTTTGFGRDTSLGAGGLYFQGLSGRRVEAFAPSLGVLSLTRTRMCSLSSGPFDLRVRSVTLTSRLLQVCSPPSSNCNAYRGAESA